MLGQRALKAVVLIAAGLVLGLLVAAVLLTAADPTASMDGTVGDLSVVSLFTAVGLLVAYRQPRNALGWLMFGAGLAYVVNIVTSEYCILVYRQGRLWHGLGPAAVLLQPFWAPAILMLVLVLLLFPDGRLPLGRWRFALWGLLALGAVWMLSAFAIAADAIARDRIRITQTGDLHALDYPTGGLAWWGVVQDVFFASIAAALVLSVGRQVVAFRRATGERQLQLKWLMWGVALLVVLGPLDFVDSQAGWWRFAPYVALIGLDAVPVCLGFAILKYRLFDIDRLISRTLSYAIVTATLVGGYVGAVAFTTRVLPFSSPVGVATATLAAAAVFNPLRRSVQGAVDRRFNRSRYDAASVVVAFADRLRETVSLDEVEDDLMAVVNHALSPTTASLWLPR